MIDKKEYEEALAIVRETKSGSITNLRNKMSIGQGKATRLLDAMEYRGIIKTVNTKRKYIEKESNAI